MKNSIKMLLAITLLSLGGLNASALAQLRAGISRGGVALKNAAKNTGNVRRLATSELPATQQSLQKTEEQLVDQLVNPVEMSEIVREYLSKGSRDELGKSLLKRDALEVGLATEKQLLREINVIECDALNELSKNADELCRLAPQEREKIVSAALEKIYGEKPTGFLDVSTGNSIARIFLKKNDSVLGRKIIRTVDGGTGSYMKEMVRNHLEKLRFANTDVTNQRIAMPTHSDVTNSFLDRLPGDVKSKLSSISKLPSSIDKKAGKIAQEVGLVLFEKGLSAKDLARLRELQKSRIDNFWDSSKFSEMDQWGLNNLWRRQQRYKTKLKLIGGGAAAAAGLYGAHALYNSVSDKPSDENNGTDTISVQEPKSNNTDVQVSNVAQQEALVNTTPIAEQSKERELQQCSDDAAEQAALFESLTTELHNAAKNNLSLDEVRGLRDRIKAVELLQILNEQEFQKFTANVAQEQHASEQDIAAYLGAYNRTNENFKNVVARNASYKQRLKDAYNNYSYGFNQQPLVKRVKSASESTVSAVSNGWSSFMTNWRTSRFNPYNWF